MNRVNIKPGENIHSPNIKGSDNKKCKNFIKDAYLSKENQNLGFIMGELKYVIEKTNILNCPITLDPQQSTFLDVALFGFYHKRLSISTIEKRLRYARFMQNHIIPVDFQNPTYENFRKHMDYREAIEKASPHALHHEWKTMRMFLEAYNLPIWPYRPPIAPISKKRNLPYPYKVREFFYFPYSEDQYETKLYQFMFQHAFLIGYRVPSEICEMTLNDIHIDERGYGSITITETKKRKQKRTIVPEKFILSSKSHKSIKNYIDNWRSKVENQHSKNALYLWPSGKPVTVRLLGHKLSQYGKKIWPDFKPYDCRHWTATSRLIQTIIDNGQPDTFTVMNWLGHENEKETKKYVKYAEMYYKAYPKSWIHEALRLIQKLRGKLHESKNRVKVLYKTLFHFPSVTLYGSRRAHILLQEKNQTEFSQNTKLCFLGNLKQLIKSRVQIPLNSFFHKTFIMAEHFSLVTFTHLLNSELGLPHLFNFNIQLINYNISGGGIDQ